MSKASKDSAVELPVEIVQAMNLLNEWMAADKAKPVQVNNTTAPAKVTKPATAEKIDSYEASMLKIPMLVKALNEAKDLNDESSQRISNELYERCAQTERPIDAVGLKPEVLAELFDLPIATN